MVRSGAVRRIPRVIRGLLPALLLAPAPAGSAGPADAAVILISLDGTSAEAGRRGLASLAELARRGAVAERLVPVFPTNTFPNHVTLVTGVHPERHGIVDNAFLDPERGAYDKEPDPTWIEVEPLWSLAEARGIPTASFHWVGSEGPWRSGRGPRYWKRFDADVEEREKVAQILAWLDLEPAARPRLVTAWFHGADRAGHRFGPDAPEVVEALRAQDAALAELLAGLGRRGALATTTLLLVSDHGMEQVRRRVDLAAELRAAGLRARVFGGGGFATLDVPGGAPAEARAVEVARRLGLEAWRRGEAPAELRLGSPRFGEVGAIAPPGVAIGTLRLRGVHGYRPEQARMAALFAAVGRGVPAGLALGEVRSIDVAPTVLALLDAPIPAWMEGRPIPALRARAERQREGVGCGG
jgi:predicted AlkP superfamily pyrophosphatase or phosphodiesterase